MLSNLLTVTGQVATLFLMMAVGFVLGRAGKITEAVRSQMSYLLLYIGGCGRLCGGAGLLSALFRRLPAVLPAAATGLYRPPAPAGGRRKKFVRFPQENHRRFAGTSTDLREANLIRSFHQERRWAPERT